MPARRSSLKPSDRKPTRLRSSKSEPPHVALLVETSFGSGRDILTGIARYVREHEPWLLFHEARSIDQELPRWLKNWKGHGIIARVLTPAMAKALRRTCIPVVDVLGVVPDAGFPLVHVDDEAIGVMAAEHLIVRGFKHFAFFGLEERNWSAARERAFIHDARRHGFETSVRRVSPRQVNDDSWEVHQRDLAEWISSLPKPVGLMVCSDHRASHVLEACRRAGVRVPDDVAVIGVDNDQPLCNICNPPLTSVWPNHALVGYEAARLLDQMMRGKKRVPARTLTPPKEIVTRQSTDTLAVQDELVAKALHIIRERVCDAIRIDEIAALVGASRSVLQRRFRAALGRTLNQELITQRVTAAQRLLIDTQLSLADIAERCGFRHQEYMGVVFKAETKQTPAQFRNQAREG
ncbi:MAG: DNA-binding transcriptional regulator [Verrucomicrobiaceae bacterium]|nr:DNA-binding transcriptional regulator [Verrucomicrobiaceae bacterium]